MRTTEFLWASAPSAGVLRMPARSVRMAVVALHGASSSMARQPMFEHLAMTLVPHDVAVLSYERRAPSKHADTELSVQVSDAIAAMRALQDGLDVPVGLFGFSQGAWAATEAASDAIASFLMVVGCSGVSPAEQMRFHADEMLRRHSYGRREREQAGALRLQLEQVLRGDGNRDLLQENLSAARTELWFPLTYLPPEAPASGVTWADMDFDPRPSVGRVGVPAIAFWGEHEDTVPREASQQIWRDADIEAQIVDLPGCGHWPLLGSERPGSQEWGADDEPSSVYSRTLSTWVTQRFR